MKALGEEWGALADTEKTRYSKLRDQLLAQYTLDMVKYVADNSTLEDTDLVSFD